MIMHVVSAEVSSCGLRNIYRNIYNSARVTGVPYIIGPSLSLSEPHIDELNVRNLYIYIYYGTYVSNLSPPRAAIYFVEAARDIFRKPHEETSALSSTTCIIIAESAKQNSVSKPKWQTLIAPPGLHMNA